MRMRRSGINLVMFLAISLLWMFGHSWARAQDQHGEARNAGSFPALSLSLITNALSSPVKVTHAGDGTQRLFVVEQGGQIKIVQNGSLVSPAFLNISPKVNSGGEKGLLGLAFHPNYGAASGTGAGKFYVYYSASGGSGDHRSIIAEYQVSAGDANVADAGSERILLIIEQPQSNHNGGDLEFGPDDGRLYISTGDGGNSNDSGTGHTSNLGNGQDRTNLLGKILRIDPDGNNGPGGQYGIPADNPFVGQGGGVREEIFAFGLRNPFRFSIDDGPDGASSADRIFAGDVGQNAREEVDLVTSGGNYGWRVREGLIATPGITTPSDPGNLIDPIAEYVNPDTGRSVIGGHVYRGQQIPGLVGKYLFGDFFNNNLFGLEESGGSFAFCILTNGPNINNLSDVGEDESGELYLTSTSGSLFKVTGSGPPQITSSLSATGTLNQSFSYTIAASGAPTITFDASPLPAGLTLNGATIEGTPAEAGSFPITLTATNGEGTDTETLVLSVQSSSNSMDTDGDGFPDDFETGAGSDPNDGASTPNNNQPASSTETLALLNAQIKLSFSKLERDQIVLKGTLPVPAGFDPTAGNVILFVGGVSKTMTLDAKGKSTLNNDKFKVQVKRKKGEVVVNTEAKFQASFKKGSFASTLASSGLADSDIPRPGQSVTVRVLILFNGALYSRTAQLIYVAKAGKKGKGKGS